MDELIKYEMEEYAKVIKKQASATSLLESTIERIMRGSNVKRVRSLPPHAKSNVPKYVPTTDIPKDTHTHTRQNDVHQSEIEEVKYDVSSPFGRRIHPITKQVSMHRGIDLRAKEGTPVYAFDSGVVQFVGRDSTNGNYVVIQHENGLTSAYAHLSQISVSTGSRVNIGQEIGQVGMTGRATGPHLHFRMKQDGKDINPAPMISNRRILG